MRRSLNIFGQDLALGVPLENPHPYGSVEREQWDAEFIAYNCIQALKDEANSASYRDPICPRPITEVQADYWRSLPWEIRKTIPKWMIGEWLNLHGDIESNATVGSNLSATDVSYNAYLLRVCGINRIRNNACYGPGINIGAIIGTILKAIAKVFSFIPGIGTVAASILGGVGALAAGENIGAALIESASNAIPGGSIAKDALQSAAKTAQSLIEGKDIGTALLDGGRKALESRGVPIEVLTAYDVGTALGTGKGLQEAGFKVLKSFVKGNDIYDRATRFADDMRSATRLGVDAERFVTVALSKDLNHAVGPALGNALSASLLERVATTPEYRVMGSPELAAVLNVTEPVARAAQAIGRYGYVDDVLRAELIKTAYQRIWEKWGLAAFEEGPLNMKFTEALALRNTELIKMSVKDDDSLKFATLYQKEQMDMNVAGKLRTSGASQLVIDSGKRVELANQGDIIVQSSESYLFKRRPFADDDNTKRFFNMGIGTLEQGIEPARVRKSFVNVRPIDYKAFDTAVKTWNNAHLVHPAVRESLRGAGAAAASNDALVRGLRDTLTDPNVKRGFDYAIGQMRGGSPFAVELETVRDTIEWDPKVRTGFDTAVAFERGRENSKVPGGLNNATQAAGFFALNGVSGSADSRTAVANQLVSNADTKQGAGVAADKSKSFFTKLLQFFGIGL